MNKRPGHVEVTTEVNYCSFCDRVRNLRREEHHLGTLVRTVITCETCHRTLSSTMGVAAVEAPADEAAPATAEVKAEAKPQPAKRAAPATKAKAAPAKPKAAPGARRAPNSNETRSAKPK
ncbi:MAG TPA: hypothetical protein VN940_09530 [Candidatus Dormibacteraeota bacterium]|nr:hypothetical protein [Candidatus Dormibacteraeota bacterium]